MLAPLASFFDAIGGARDTAGAFVALRALSSSLGFEEAVLGRYRADPRAGVHRPAEFAATDPHGVRRYLELVPHDPIAALMSRVVRPKVIRTARIERLCVTPEAARLAEDPYVRASALRIAMPAASMPDGGRWILVLGGTDLVTERREAEVAVPVLWLAAAAATTRIAAIGPALDARLTRRERECLLRLARGERVDRIADRLGLSNATVGLHLAGARRRLGARTSAEAVARAILGGLIAP